MTTTLGLVLALFGAGVASLGLYLVILAIASFGYRAATFSASGDPGLRLAVLVPAHDEELLVARCVRSLAAQDYPLGLLRVIVIADNCADRTAIVASDAGAEVFVRDDTARPGKGHALRWAMDRLLDELEPPVGIAVVDADSVADPDMVAALAAELRGGHDAVQADYSILREPFDGPSAMVEAGFILFHRVRFRGRAQLGMPANLVGNGMLFSRRLLELVPWSSFTGVEDLEQSIRLRLAGVRTRFAPNAHVAGPGPASRAGATRQRMRWEGGRFHVMRHELGRLILAAAVRRDPTLLEAALDLATPPLAMLSLASGAGVLITGALAFAGLAPWWSALPWALAVAALPLFVGLGLWSAGSPQTARVVIAGAPGFVVWKALTYLRILRGHDVKRWDRTDRIAS